MNDELKLVVFDCDGTLVDSQAMIIEAMQQAFFQQGVSVPGRKEIRSIIGLSLEQAIAHLSGENCMITIDGLSNAYKAAFVELRNHDETKEPLYPGALEFLQGLAARDDVLLGVATGKSRRGVDVLFERENLHQYFTTIQTADTAPSKPHPHMLHEAMSETGARPGNTYMIGDTTFDMAMARAANTGALGVSWGYHPVEELKDAGAHSIADEFDDLKKMMPTIYRPEKQVA